MPDPPLGAIDLLWPKFTQDCSPKIFNSVGPFSNGLFVNCTDFVVTASSYLILAIGAMHNQVATSHQILKSSEC